MEKLSNAIGSLEVKGGFVPALFLGGVLLGYLLSGLGKKHKKAKALSAEPKPA